MGEVKDFAIEIPFPRDQNYETATWAGISSFSTNGFLDLLL
jgi:hypothetical protein